MCLLGNHLQRSRGGERSLMRWAVTFPRRTFVTDIVLPERQCLGPRAAKLGKDGLQPASRRGQGHFATKVTATIASPHSLRHP